jgi:hypothetical protein
MRKLAVLVDRGLEVQAPAIAHMAGLFNGFDLPGCQNTVFHG